MLIELKKIPDGGLHVQRNLALGPVPEDEDLLAVQDAEVNLYILEDEEDILVSGSFSTRVTLTCARCLEPFELPVSVSFNAAFRPRPQEFPEEAQVHEEDLDLSYIDPDLESLDLREVVMEQVLLSLPMKPLHDPECRGLCPRCGTNRNEKDCSCIEGAVDPRLEALARIRESMDKD